MVGFQRKTLRLPFTKNQKLDIELEDENYLREVVISSKSEQNKQSNSPNMSKIDLPVDQIKNLPTLMGEKDVLKIIQLLPGVQKASEGQSGIYVRGGGPDQNLILLDGVPIYNVSHLFGFFSTFNSDAISNVTLIKGGFPARYGGRASSVLDMRMKEGNMKKYNVEGSLGLISSRLLVEGPIKKDKTSFSISGRRTYLDALFRPFLVALEGVDAGYFFHDFNAKIQHKINDKHHIYLSGYFGLDKVFVKDQPSIYYDGDATQFVNRTKSALKWGNSIGALRWNYKINPKLFLNTTATFSKYQFSVGLEDETKITKTDGTKELEKYAFYKCFCLLAAPFLIEQGDKAVEY
jgi:outer membrane cobalamin receptor